MLRPLKQSASYDVPSTTSAQPRMMSIDHTSDIVRRNVTPPIQTDEIHQTWNTAEVSNPSSEYDNQETNAWSSDYSNSEDEFTILEENAMPVSSKFILPMVRGFLNISGENCMFHFNNENNLLIISFIFFSHLLFTPHILVNLGNFDGFSYLFCEYL